MKWGDPFGMDWMCNYYILYVNCSIRIDSEIFSSWTSSWIGTTIPSLLLVTLDVMLTEVWLSSFRLAAPQSIHDLREALWTVGVSEREIGRIYAMCLSIRPLRDPVRTITGYSGLLSNESTDTTDGEQRRLFP
jgi:hypothetical protein